MRCFFVEKRVATHKLRVEGLDTFWFVAQEDGYALHPERDIAKARPGYNAPKLWAALSSLFDLRLVDRNADGGYLSTNDGERLLQRALATET